MSDEHLPDDRLGRATAALRDTPVPEMPADLVAQVVQATAAGKPDQTNRRRKIPMKTILRMAAALMVGASVLVFLMVMGTPQVTFAEAITALKEFKTVRMQIKVVTQIPNGDQFTNEGEMIVVAPDKARTTMEAVDTVTPQGRGHSPAHASIVDWATGQELRLDLEAKTATLRTTTGVPEEGRPINFIRTMMNTDAKDAKPLGDKEIDGKKVQGFELQSPQSTMTVWIDPATRLPVLVESVLKGSPLYPSGTLNYSDFVWNEEIDPKLVSLDVPEGYTVKKLATTSHEVTEKDLLTALKDVSDFLKGRYPDQFDTFGLSHDIGYRVGMESNTNTPEQQKKLVDQSMDVQRSAGRAWMFMMTSKYGSDFQYAGKGKKAGTKDPILWYLPAGAQKYRLIDASLNVTEVSREELPKVKSQPLSAPVPAK